MNHIHKIDISHNLLLNLLTRETSNWYYLDIIPRYDESLARYMQSFSYKGFFRFDLPSISSVIYFPLVYRSLTGMHYFGDCPAYRKKETDKVVPLSYQEAILQILKQSFPSFIDSEINLVLNKLENSYYNLVKTMVKDVLPATFISAFPNLSGNSNSVGSKVIPSATLINEYGNCHNLSNLLFLMEEYVAQIELPINKAVVDWTKQYCTCLLSLTLENYITENSMILPNLQSTEVVLDDMNYTMLIRFISDSSVFLHKQLPESFNREKLDHLINAHLLTHHIYPLLCGLGLLGLTTEEELLNEVAETITQFKNQFSPEATFLDHIHTRVKSFLPELLNILETEFVLRQVHLHNHTINNQYYAHELIKPLSGRMVHKHYFNDDSIEIGIRGFDISIDLETLHEWVNLDYAKKFWEMDGPIQNLEEAYIKHLGVDYSHPYIGTLNGEPLFTLELYWAIKDEVGKYYPFHSGDYGFHLLISPAKQRIPKLSYFILTTCMEHFFSFRQVHRIIGEASVEHVEAHKLITKIGCEFDKVLVLPYKTSNLTFLTRESFYEAVKDVLDNSHTEILINI